MSHQDFDALNWSRTGFVRAIDSTIGGRPTLVRVTCRSSAFSTLRQRCISSSVVTTFCDHTFAFVNVAGQEFGHFASRSIVEQSAASAHILKTAVSAAFTTRANSNLGSRGLWTPAYTDLATPLRPNRYPLARCRICSTVHPSMPIDLAVRCLDELRLAVNVRPRQVSAVATGTSTPAARAYARNGTMPK